MVKYNFKFKKICTPAFLYFVLSIISFVVLGLQNVDGDDKKLCAGSYTCSVASKSVIFILHAIYIMFWTFVLDLMCKNGYEKISWLIVLLPILLFFITLTIIMIYYPVV